MTKCEWSLEKILFTLKYMKDLCLLDRSGYEEYGTLNDTVVKRINYNMKEPLLH